MAPTKVLLASPRGYCAGVDRAVDTVERALDHFGAPVYVRKEIVHNGHVVRDLSDRGAVFVDSELDVPARRRRRPLRPRGRARRLPQLQRPRPADDRRHLPAGDEGAHGGQAVRRRRLHHRPGRPRGPRGGRRHHGRGAGLDPADRVGRRDRRPGDRRSRARRLHHADHAVGRRDGGDHRRAARAVPGDRRAEEGRHLLRHPEPAERGQAAGARGRSGAGDRLAELVELEPAGRRDARDGRARPT